MFRKTVLLVGAGAIALLGGCAQTGTATAPQTATSVSTVDVGSAKNGWGFEVYDQTPDPAVRMGTLANGMKYAVMRNETPKGGAAMRMRFTVGWMYETPQERGLAHMIEHLALNETKNLPEGALLKRLQLHGLQFGADTNAHTTFHETVYKLDIPNAAPNILDDALFIMREVGGNATFGKDTVDRERGIILSERQLREGYQRQSVETAIRFATPQTTLADGLKPDDAVIKNASPDLIRALYNRYYRPENATLVVTGDFDPAAMEAKIVKDFSDWRGVGPAGGAANLGPIDFARKTDSGVFVHPAVVESFSIATLTPYKLESQSLAEVRKRMPAAIGDAIMRRRIAKLAQRPDSPILGGGSASSDSLFQQARQAQLSVVAKDGQLKQAVGLAEQEYRRAMDHGFTESELKEALANMEAGLRAARDQASTRRSNSLAEAILDTHDERQVFTTPAFDYAWFQQQIPTFTAKEVSAAWRAEREGVAPLYFANSKSPLTKEQLAGWVMDSQKVAVAAPVEAAAAAFAYTNFGQPGKVVEDKQIGDLGIRTIRFANGVRLNLKKTDFEVGKLRYNLRFGSGILALPKDKPGLGMFINSSFAAGGLEKHSYDDIRSILAGKVVGLAGIGANDDAFTMSGGTVASDLEVQLQLLAAQLTAPGYRPEAQAQWDGSVPVIDKQLGATAMGVMSRNLPRLMNNDPRFGIPDGKTLAARNQAEEKALMADQLAKGPIELALVGDFDEAAAIAAVAKTLGALPQRAAAAATLPGANTLAFTTSRKPVTLTHSGTVDQGMVVAVWPGPDNSDLKRSMEMRLLTAVGTIMMQDEIREKLGATYSPNFGASMSDIFAGYGTITALAPGAPDKADEIFAAYDTVMKELRDQPISDELMNRARIPLVEQLEKATRENAQWMGVVDQAQTRPQDLDRWRQRVGLVRAVTPADLQRLAQRYLVGEPLRIKVISEQAAAK